MLDNQDNNDAQHDQDGGDQHGIDELGGAEGFHEGAGPRSVDRLDRRPHPLDANAKDAPGINHAAANDPAHAVANDPTAVPLDGLGFADVIPPVGITSAHFESTQGALPPPAMMQAYDELVPGSAARMMELHLETEAANVEAIRGRTWSMKRVVRAESNGVLVGALSSIAVILIAVSGVIAAAMGAPWGITALSMVPALLYGTAAVTVAMSSGRKPPREQSQKDQPG